MFPTRSRRPGRGQRQDQTGDAGDGLSPVLAFVVIEIFVLVFLFEVFVLVFLLEIFVFVLALILVFVFEVFVLVVGLPLFLFVIELFIERFTCAVGGFLSARRADAILDRCAARTAGGAST
jgi:hypothetical protein